MKRWSRRNLVALIAVAVLLPATLGAVGWGQWWAANYASAVFPTTGAAGEPTEFDGVTWGPAAIEVDAAVPGELPAGTHAVVVTIPVDQDADQAVVCTTPLLREASGREREWAANTYDTGWEYDEEHPTFCSEERSGPYSIVIPYLVPDDAVGPFTVDVTTGTGLPGFVRLPLG